jgi:uncharacterized protein with PIN domain
MQARGGATMEMPKCPYCKEPITLKSLQRDTQDDEVDREVYGTVKKEVMYSCPHCGSVLGFGSFVGGLFTGRP